MSIEVTDEMIETARRSLRTCSCEGCVGRAIAAVAPLIEARAIKRAAWMAKHACLVEPDGGSPTQAECDLCDEAERRILALIPAAPSANERTDNDS